MGVIMLLLLKLPLAKSMLDVGIQWITFSTEIDDPVEREYQRIEFKIIAARLVLFSEVANQQKKNAIYLTLNSHNKL